MLTAANIVISVTVPPIFPAPFQIQGFGPDSIFDIDSLQSTEVQMGVDGRMSGGFVYTPVPQSFTLSADSESNDLFEIWWLQQVADETVFEAVGITIIPAIGKKYTMTQGMLTGYSPAPAAGRILQPRRHQITWGRITPSPL